jgi:hypothetical protein
MNKERQNCWERQHRIVTTYITIKHTLCGSCRLECTKEEKQECENWLWSQAEKGVLKEEKFYDNK